MKIENNEKVNILKKVNHKIKMRGLKIAFFSVFVCFIISFVALYFIFFKETPIDASNFQGVNIEMHKETINEMDSRELTYNHLNFSSKKVIWYSIIEGNGHFYINKNEDNETTSLYFYVSETLSQKYRNKKLKDSKIDFIRNEIKHDEDDKKQVENTTPWSILLSTTLCKTDLDTILKEVTHVYYLIADYDKLNSTVIDELQKDAVLLWAKSEKETL